MELMEDKFSRKQKVSFKRKLRWSKRGWFQNQVDVDNILLQYLEPGFRISKQGGKKVES